jgi:membrane-bound ClpP family serine protease
VARLSVLEATLGGGTVRAPIERSGLPARGSAGTATSVLRPSGRVTIDGEPFDAVSAEGFIEAGTPIRVVGHHAEAVLVERTP